MTEAHGLADPLADPKEPIVDIVFVHGLGGDRTSTWTWEGNGKKLFWPKDLLPETCPTARILSFGYRAEFAHFFPKSTPEQHPIDDHSTALLQGLTVLRSKTNSTERPVIFVCHSLGGLVCANALSKPHNTDWAAAELAIRTVGVIFLGTPFEGSSKEQWAVRGLKVLEWIGSKENKKKEEEEEHLEGRSEKLTQINDAFQKFLERRDKSKSGHVKVACFFEEFTTENETGKDIDFVVPKKSSCLLGIDPQPIQDNHANMCKFDNKFRIGYKTISQQLHQWVSDLDRRDIADRELKHSVYMGDVNYKNKIDNNYGVVMGHAYSTATDGNRITGSSTTNYYGFHPNETNRSTP